MVMTTNFLRCGIEELETLKQDQSKLRELAASLESSPCFLDMDNAGPELLLILDPKSFKSQADAKRSRYPNLVSLLGGGEPLYNVNLGNGPVKLVTEDILRKALEELERLKIKELLNMASHEDVIAVLNFELGEAECREYHWAHLESLNEFVREAVLNSEVVLRV
jgi:hypothetical protein